MDVSVGVSEAGATIVGEVADTVGLKGERGMCILQSMAYRESRPGTSNTVDWADRPGAVGPSQQDAAMQVQVQPQTPTLTLTVGHCANPNAGGIVRSTMRGASRHTCKFEGFLHV